MKKRFVILGISAVIACGGAYGWWHLLQQTHQPTNTAQNTSQHPTSPELITLALPHTSAITALKENYDDPTSQWVVVSKDHPLPDSSFVPSDLAKAPVTANPSKSSEEQSLRSLIFPAVSKMFGDAKSAGYDLMIASGYRSYALQKTYFDNYARTDGVEAANKYSALPGQSEHQTGLSFDISYTDRHCYLDTCFGETPAGVWLATHAYEYGFVLRYPADKTEITKYQYEPWHFRYVGTDLANALHKSNLTLDEAYPYLQETLKKLRDQKQI